MIKKLIVVMVVVIAVLGLAFATLGNSGDKNISNNSTNNSNGPVKQETIPINNTTQGTTYTIISSQEAQKIASKYIQVSEATTGTPKLMELNGEKVFIVPVVIKGTIVGEIDIDAKTGKNVGGAGGSP